MATKASIARALSVRAPIASEGERALFQRRLALILLVVFVLAFGFFALQLVTAALFEQGDVGLFLGSRGVLVQLVEIPGLIEGASDDRGGGRALLGVLRSADAIVYCVRATGDATELAAVRAEVAAAGIDKPAFLAATQADEAPPGAIDGLAATFPDLPVVPVSVLDEASLDAFCVAVWSLTGLIRVWLRKDGATDEEPIALDPGSTVADVADSIHHDLASSFSGARVWGPSARFEGQRVGRDHEVSDGDVVEIVV